MPKQTLVIVTGSPEKTGSQLLLAAAVKQVHRAELVIIGEQGAADRINAADVAIFRVSPKIYDLYHAILPQLREPLRQQLARSLAAFDKLETYRILHGANVPTPLSHEVTGSVYDGPYPVVAKILNGNQGRGVELIKNADDWDRFKQAFPDDETVLLQEFVAESRGSDKRLFMVGERCVAAMCRAATTDDFRANIHLGGKVEVYEPSDIEVQYAAAAMRAFGLDFAGVDIIDSNRGPLVLEVNPSPGFGIQSLSANDIPSEVIKGVMND